MELRQLQDKAASYENENERFQRSLLEAHQKLADERVKSEAKEKGLIFMGRVLGSKKPVNHKTIWNLCILSRFLIMVSLET